jgi:hypothetical protein
MKTFYQITTKETGVVILRRRKIAKAFRWWLRENGFDCQSAHCTKYSTKRANGRRLSAERDLAPYAFLHENYSLNFDR